MKKIQRLTSKKQIIGYTTGVYDLFHIGHLNILRKARSLCDYLIVGVSTDSLVLKSKNKSPVITYTERKQIVSSIVYVDKVVPQFTRNKICAYKKYKYDILFVGSDWENSAEFIKYEKYLKDFNVKVKYFPYTCGTSSTLLKAVLEKL
jgi:glycerol-3-phosphate cytidylyltransferase